MLRRINYTGRVKINREDVNITAREIDGSLVFNAVLRLADYEFPREARVFIEAYRQTNWMRFAFGTVGNIQPPPQSNRILSNFDSGDGILFRVKITQGLEEPVLLASVDRIPIMTPDADAGKESLLPIQQADLGDELWRITFTDGPLLQVNKNSAIDLKQMAVSPVFQSLIYPAIIRQILTYILIIDELRDKEDDSWQSKWLRFASLLPGIDPEPPAVDRDREEVISWIDEAVEGFSKNLNLKDIFSAAWHEKGGI